MASPSPSPASPRNVSSEGNGPSSCLRLRRLLFMCATDDRADHPSPTTSTSLDSPRAFVSSRWANKEAKLLNHASFERHPYRRNADRKGVAPSLLMTREQEESRFILIRFDCLTSTGPAFSQEPPTMLHYQQQLGFERRSPSGEFDAPSPSPTRTTIRQAMSPGLSQRGTFARFSSSTPPAETHSSTTQNEHFTYSPSPMNKSAPEEIPPHTPTCDYTQPEEEWYHEGLLDPIWEQQQKKTFTAWCNSHLRKVETSIDVIEEDFRDGLKLMLLLEVISGEPLEAPERGRMIIHKVANINKALSFIESKGVKLVCIGAKEIADGNVKITLGLIWMVILRFAIQEISVGELSAKDGLLLWCQRKTASYHNVSIQDFHNSWRDGLAFCALIHRHRPDLLNYNALSRDDPLHNLNLAFDIAEKYLDIPRMLDPELMVHSPDERATMTYVSSYYHYFLGMHKAETAANRICRVLNVNRENEQFMEDYDTMASELVAWIRRWQPWLENRPENDTLAIVKSKLNQFRHYRREEKPPRIAEKGQLETLFNTLQTKLRLSNRPAFLPKEGHLIKDINYAWEDLEHAETGFEEWVLAEIKRLETLEHLAEKFRRKCATHEEWARGKVEMLQSEDWRTARVDGIKALKKRHEAFESDLGSHQDRVEQIAAIAKELTNLRYPEIGPIQATCNSICQQWDQIGMEAEERHHRLDEMERVAERLDGLHLDFAKQAAPFSNWLDGAREDLADIVLVHKMSEVEELLKAHEQFKATIAGAGHQYQALQALENELAHLVEKHHLNAELKSNPYTDISMADVARKWTDVKALTPKRDHKLQEEYNRQRNNERLTKLFAEKANVVAPWLEQHLDRVVAIGLSPAGSLESAVRDLRQIQTDAHNFKSSLDEIERINQEMQENYVYEHKGTRFSMETLRVGYETLLTSINKTISEIENQILMRDSKGIKEEQINEYRSSFNHFDKDRVGLDEEQLKSCLISVGYNIRNGPDGDEDMHRILNLLDPNRFGRVPFDAFLDFMTRETADMDTVEQMIDSFRILAGGKDHITVEELRNELPPEQAEYCIRKMDQFHLADGFDYVAFAKTLYN
ncbi:hypothetical protein QR680_004543 [Steinernema hermaphroditum]|uniref:Uncharacterized protein n=1 Tax=Steinernema hermaphroditum TaxID=289476 RepID=A0AA39LU59_9BILA|nr:hypothetical protein QR680_004543 [Steinernema hermaphroditum]